MPDIKLIAMDMDGTLLTRIDPRTACIPPENARVLREAHQRGIHLALASGRMPDDAGFFAVDADIPMHIISLNGGVTLDVPFGTPCDARWLPPETVQTVLEIMQSTTLDCAVFGAWEVVSLRERPLSWAQIVLGTYFGRDGGRLVYRSGGEGLADLPHVAKIVALTDHDAQSMAAAKDRILAACPDVEISSSWWNNFEVNPAGVNKGTALTRLADRLGIPMSQVMAIGDNDNDIPMLEQAGYGVAMGNATATAQRSAAWRTLSNDQHGVAAAIRALAFGEHVPGVIRL